MMCGMKLPIHTQTSTMQTLKFSLLYPTRNWVYDYLSMFKVPVIWLKNATILLLDNGCQSTCHRDGFGFLFLVDKWASHACDLFFVTWGVKGGWAIRYQIRTGPSALKHRADTAMLEPRVFFMQRFNIKLLSHKTVYSVGLAWRL